jgi:hypothetical protein
MPRPTRQSRTPCAILSLSCAAATLMLPTAAHGTVTVTESNQTFGEEFFSHRLIFSRTLIGPVDYGLNGRYQSEIASGGTPTVSDMQFVTTYGAGPLPSGTFAVNTHLDPGLAGQGSVMITSLLAGYSISFTTDQPTQLALFGSSRLTRGDSTPGRPGQLRLETLQSLVFSWGSSNETGELATLDTIIDLAPGTYRLVFNCGMTATERFGNAPPSPTLLDFNMSFAIIPSPATLLPLAALPFLAAARRRRPSGR